MKKQFKRIILYARQHRANHGVNETLQRVASFLKDKKLEVTLDVETALSFSMALPILKRSEMGQAEDLIIVVGGDGSLLSAARMAIDVGVPVLGINRGRLGFLTDISPKDLDEELEAILAGQYKEEKRFLLHTHIHHEEQTLFRGDALNDVVLGRGTATHLVEFDVLINQQFVSHFRSDGMIISTPTGSTAYALSAGGPIMHPQLNAIVLVPMFSHSLSSRPIVVDGQGEIELRISPSNEMPLSLSCDGHAFVLVEPGQVVTIAKKTQELCLLHPCSYHYYDTLRSKLGWESKYQSE